MAGCTTISVALKLDGEVKMPKVSVKQLGISAGSNISISSEGVISSTASGGGRPVVSTISSNTTISNPAASDSWVIYNSTSATAISVTLPTAVGISGMRYDIKRSGAGAVTVNTTSAQTIDGLASVLISSQYANLSVISDNSNWIII